MRTFSLPVDVDADKIMAEFQNGLLTIEVPKPEPTQAETDHGQLINLTFKKGPQGAFFI